MKRHPGLLPLSHDHHHGLVHAYRMTKAAEGRKDPDTVADAFLAFYPNDLLRHFHEEEEVLVPLLPEDDPQRVRLLDEHARFHTLVDALRDARARNEDLKPTLAATGAFLERHIRFEERELFPRLEQMLSDDELLVLSSRFAGGPQCGITAPAD